MQTVNARELACPEPVMLTRKALKTLPDGEQLEVLVSTTASRENVSRMAEAKGWQVQIEEVADTYRLIIGK